MIDTDIMKDASEVIHYDRPGVPLYIQNRKLSFYPNMRALCHWHEDIEFIHILRGKMNYDVNGKKILLKEGDSLMINAAQMHYGYSSNRQECDFICVLFHPNLLTGNRILCQSYIQPVIQNKNLEYLYFDAKTDGNEEIAAYLKNFISLKNKKSTGYELEIIGNLHLLWSRLYRHKASMFPLDGFPEYSDISLQKTMVSYIYQHYTEKITLDDIADSANVCRSKCCSVFKRYLQQSPIDFLIAYRLKVSSNLLRDTDTSITQIALACGFNHLSYFSKLFLRHYGCTPSEYRSAK